MANENFCKNCGKPIDNKAVICTSCGVKIKKPIFKKWWFWLIVAIVVILLVSSGDNDSNNGNTTQHNSETVQAETPIPATKTPKQENKGTVDGKYDVEIVSSKIADDYQGSPCIIVTFNFTNNSDKNASFLTSVGAKAFQNSVQCNTAIVISDAMDAQPSLSEVQPGGTIAVECAYSLHDTTNPVTIQVGPFINISNEINAQKVFTIAQ